MPSQISTIITQSPFPTSTIQPSATPTLLQITATITPELYPGLTLWQVNIRNGPGFYFTLIGQINQNQSIQITGMDATSEWYAIDYPSGPEGRGWVTAEYVQVSGKEQIPVIGQVTLTNGTPAPQASLTQKLNVRSGPGTNYDSLGILPENSIIWLTGRNESGSWLQIDYPTTPGGKGWVIAGYVQAQDILNLPALNSSGMPLADLPSSQVTMQISTPTPTIVPAYPDDDSAAKPGANYFFSPLGIRSFSYTSDLSSPEGDPVDWIAVRTDTSQSGAQASIYSSLTCTSNGSVQIQLLQEDQQLPIWDDLTCGDINKPLMFSDDSDYLIRLSINASSELRYVLYTFTLSISP